MNQWHKYKYHIYFWAFWGALLLLQDSISNYLQGRFEQTFTWHYFYWFVLHMVLVTGVTYGYAYLLKIVPYSGNKTKWLLSSLALQLSVTAVFSFFRTYVTELLFGSLSAEYLSSFLEYFPWLLRTSLVFMIVGFGYRILLDYFEEQKKRQTLEKMALVAELSSLKNQINPHFLYNTLSYLHAQAEPLSESLGEAILLLSDMMRYSLHDTDETGLVSLEKEVSHIKNFITIHQLRFGNKLAVEFTVEGNVTSKRILPLVLISFVENAFKHGKTTKAEEPVQIQLQITPDSSLVFTVKNRKSEGPKENSSGIGLNNVRRRLELVYPNSHQLTINDTKHYFEVNLVINHV